MQGAVEWAGFLLRPGVPHHPLHAGSVGRRQCTADVGPWALCWLLMSAIATLPVERGSGTAVAEHQATPHWDPASQPCCYRSWRHSEPVDKNGIAIKVNWHCDEVENKWCTPVGILFHKGITTKMDYVTKLCPSSLSFRLQMLSSFHPLATSSNNKK